MKENRKQTSSAETETNSSGIGVIMLPIIHRSPTDGDGGGGAGTGQGSTKGFDGDLDTLVDPPPLGGDGTGGSATPPNKDAAQTPEQIEAAKKVAEKAKADEETAKKFGGVKLDEKGNAVDATGKVVKTADEIAKGVAAPLSQTTVVEVDGVTYNLNDKGDALNADGTVFKTKADLDALETEQVPVPQEFIQKVGIVVKGDDGKPKVYEDSVEGLIEAANDIVAVKLQESQRHLFDAFPKAEKYIRHLRAGGTDEQFFQVLQDDYSKVTIDDNNTQQHENLIRQLFIKRGFSAADAEDQIKLIKDANKLLEKGKSALTELKGIQAKSEKDKEERNQRALQAEEKRVNDYWEGVKEIVTKGTVADAIIPEADRTKFFEYMSKPVTKEGYSQAMIDADKESDEVTVFIDLLRYYKWDMSKLVKAAVGAEKVKSLRTRLLKKDTPASGGVQGNQSTPGRAADVDINTLIPN